VDPSEVITISRKVGFPGEEAFSIQCPFDSQRWLKNGLPLPGYLKRTATEMKIVELTEWDSGVYECLRDVSNPPTIVYRHITEVYVGGKPYIQLNVLGVWSFSTVMVSGQAQKNYFIEEQASSRSM